MQRILHRAAHRATVVTAASLIVLAAAGCHKPMVMESITGRPRVFPDVVAGKPTLVAFLSANDRRCDRALRPLASLHHRDGTPVQVLGVLAYDDYKYVRAIETVEDAPFTILLDPDLRLGDRFSISQYPTYIFLDTEGDEIDRAHDIREVRPWVDSPRWHEKAFGMKAGTINTYERLKGQGNQERARTGYAQPQPSSGASSGASADRYDPGRPDYERYQGSRRNYDGESRTYRNPRDYDPKYDRSYEDQYPLPEK